MQQPLGIGAAAPAKRAIRALVGVGNGKNVPLHVAVFADGAHRTGWLVCLRRGGRTPRDPELKFTVPDPIVVVELVEQVADAPGADTSDRRWRRGGHP